MPFELTFLGTGAADFSPELETAYKDRFDNDIRRCSSVLVNGHILIDCGPHTVGALNILKTALSAITDIFVTHLHNDHIRPDAFSELIANGANPRIWCRAGADLQLTGAQIIGIAPLTDYDCGGITVSAIEANHDAFPVHYIFQHGGKKFFYGCDGAWMLNKGYYYLKNAAFDAMILDATVGDYEGDYRMAEHNSIPMIRMMLKSFASFGITTANTKIYLSHMSRRLHHDTHAERTARLVPEGMTPVCDGMIIQI
jgi:ribonuclease BN (tRNA processing enzyme)